MEVESFIFYNPMYLETALGPLSEVLTLNLCPGQFSQHQEQPEETFMMQLLSHIYWIAWIFKSVYKTINTWFRYSSMCLPHI